MFSQQKMFSANRMVVLDLTLECYVRKRKLNPKTVSCAVSYTSIRTVFYVHYVVWHYTNMGADIYATVQVPIFFPHMVHWIQPIVSSKGHHKSLFQVPKTESEIKLTYGFNPDEELEH